MYHKCKVLLEEIKEIENNAKIISKTEKYSIKIGYLKNYIGHELQNTIYNIII